MNLQPLFFSLLNLARKETGPPSIGTRFPLYPAFTRAQVDSLVLVSRMEDISSKFGWNESQSSGGGFRSISILFSEYSSEVAAAVSLLLAFITVGYLFWKRLENVFSYKQWGYSKQVSPFVECYMSNTNLIG